VHEAGPRRLAGRRPLRWWSDTPEGRTGALSFETRSFENGVRHLFRSERAILGRRGRCQTPFA